MEVIKLLIAPRDRSHVAILIARVFKTPYTCLKKVRKKRNDEVRFTKAASTSSSSV
jgi:hypothetical protein